MMAVRPWLWIVGIGEDGYNGLNAEAKRAIASATMLYGGSRHVALIPAAGSMAERVCWPSPMASAVQYILEELRGKTTVTVLASGDPMLYGVGVTLTKELSVEEFRVVPQVSAFSLACARLGWPIATTTLVSLVHRPIEELLRNVCPGERLVVFSEDGETPLGVARLLTRHGYGLSVMTVFESLGGGSEKVTTEIAAKWPETQRGKLNVIALQCISDVGGMQLSTAPGLPEDAFESDGQITKREVRAVTLARLAPMPRQLLWDVGAGSGSIGIEWMRMHRTCRCIAFELRGDRAARIRENAVRLGVGDLKIVEGRAPDTFADVESPGAIFIGGDVSNEALFSGCWERLAGGGRLVANAVTLQSEAVLIARHAMYGGDLMRMMVSRADAVGGAYGWRPMMPITQWTVTKP
ncbi:MAG: precorrin-6y C5,15-methyltransferase (decarboxylating) subunit CbiE [Acidobacteria bacterium]|nr:precorrin-6y C5,15-methyltransferase (decarboxylating) subunit CbiE [Acidobacteriota bacterium]